MRFDTNDDDAKYVTDVLVDGRVVEGVVSFDLSSGKVSKLHYTDEGDIQLNGDSNKPLLAEIEGFVQIVLRPDTPPETVSKFDSRHILNYDDFVPTNRLSVYLSGSYSTDWREAFTSRFPNLIFTQSIKKYGLTPVEYVEQSKTSIRLSDIFLLYLHKDTPYTDDFMFELAYASALDKFIIFIDEDSPRDEGTDYPRIFAKNSSHIATASFDEGLRVMQFVSLISLLFQRKFHPIKN